MMVMAMMKGEPSDSDLRVEPKRNDGLKKAQETKKKSKGAHEEPLQEVRVI